MLELETHGVTKPHSSYLSSLFESPLVTCILDFNNFLPPSYLERTRLTIYATPPNIERATK